MRFKFGSMKESKDKFQTVAVWTNLKLSPMHNECHVEHFKLKISSSEDDGMAKESIKEGVKHFGLIMCRLLARRENEDAIEKE